MHAVSKLAATGSQVNYAGAEVGGTSCSPGTRAFSGEHRHRRLGGFCEGLCLQPGQANAMEKATSRRRFEATGRDSDG